MSKSLPKKRTAKIRPTLEAVVLADDVYTDAVTNKKIIAGTFNQLWSNKFPSRFGKTTKAYLVLTNCRGPQKLKIRYIDLQDESVLMESPEFKIMTENPLERHEVVMDVPPFPMPHEGQYAFEVYCNGELLGGIRVNVDISKTPKAFQNPR